MIGIDLEAASYLFAIILTYTKNIHNIRINIIIYKMSLTHNTVRIKYDEVVTLNAKWSGKYTEFELLLERVRAPRADEQYQIYHEVKRMIYD